MTSSIDTKLIKMSDKPVKKQKGFSYVQLSSGKRGPGRPAGWKKFAIPTAIVSALLIVALLVTITALVVTFTRRGPIQPPVPTRRCDLSSYERFDCLPGIAEPRHDTCLDVGCCWNESETPFCYYSSESGYTVEDKFQYTQVGIRGCLTAKKSSSTAFGESLQRVCVNITFETEDRLHVKVSKLKYFCAYYFTSPTPFPLALHCSCMIQLWRDMKFH